ncbi:phosphopantetheinyl transferase [Pseudomonas congelans]|nr:phosphopantetheinyl transferase [Pseudomonas congelans]
MTFISAAGVAPRLLIDGLPEPGFSISHEAGFSLAAVNLQGAVGVDLMQVQAVPDWHAVALDYLGAEVATGLSGMPESIRPIAFAKAWCRREAFLKLYGLALEEWTAVGVLHGVGVEVELEEGMVGVVALSRGLMEYLNQAERRTDPELGLSEIPDRCAAAANHFKI